MRQSIRASLLTLLLLSLAACAGDTPSESKAKQVSAKEAADLLINRNWMDVWPESETEKLNVFRFVPSMGGGVFQDRTLFKGTFELFTFKVDGDIINFDLHFNKEKVPAKFRIERVSGPKPFDLRLTLDASPRGPSVYYGRSSETTTDLALHPLK